MKKAPIVVEKFTDNGEHSHYNLIDQETGDLLWSEAPEEEMQKVKSALAPVSLSETAVCFKCEGEGIVTKGSALTTCTTCWGTGQTGN